MPFWHGKWNAVFICPFWRRRDIKLCIYQSVGWSVCKSPTPYATDNLMPQKLQTLYVDNSCWVDDLQVLHVYRGIYACVSLYTSTLGWTNPLLLQCICSWFSCYRYIVSTYRNHNTLGCILISPCNTLPQPSFDVHYDTSHMICIIMPLYILIDLWNRISRLIAFPRANSTIFWPLIKDNSEDILVLCNLSFFLDLDNISSKMMTNKKMAHDPRRCLIIDWILCWKLSQCQDKTLGFVLK